MIYTSTAALLRGKLTHSSMINPPLDPFYRVTQCHWVQVQYGSPTQWVELWAILCSLFPVGTGLGGCLVDGWCGQSTAADVG